MLNTDIPPVAKGTNLDLALQDLPNPAPSHSLYQN